MKYFFLLIVFGLWSWSVNAQSSVYLQSISLTDGQSISLSVLQGKRIAIFLLPSSSATSDSLFLRRIDSLASAYQTDVQFIAVPSREDGFDADSTALLSWCQGIVSEQVWLMQPVSTHKSSSSQHPLFKWLTNLSGNTHFDDEVGGASSIYFINETGELYGVFNPDARFSNRALSKVL